MAVVIDSSALIALAEDQPVNAEWVQTVLESESCYLPAPMLVEMYYTVLLRSGMQEADHWLSFTEGPDFHVIDQVGHELISLTAQALWLDSTLSESAAFGAALARQMNVELVSATPRFNALARSGFCRIAKPPMEL